MRRRASLILAVAAAAAASMAVVASASAAPARPAGGAQRLAAGNPWGQAREVPGTAALNTGHQARITSVSCASAGNCSAGGYYTTALNAAGASTIQAFVVSEVHGRWRKAETVPGTAALKAGFAAEITSVSCASAGNCSAGGRRFARAFVVSEVHGRWRKVHILRQGHGASITAVSCASAGNCSAGGSYGQVFVVSEVHGRWRKAETVLGSFHNNDAGGAQINSMSCASAGNCIAGGYFPTRGRLGTNRQEAIVVSEVHGTWQNLEEVPGTAAPHGAPFTAQITSVSCTSAGNCSAGGSDGSASGIQAFVVSEVHGTWQTAEEVPGTAALNTGGSAQITSVSCASAGNCSAGGYYWSGVGIASTRQAFVVTEVHGTWQTAKEVPGTAALNTDGIAQITSVSCASAGNCSAGGTYAAGYYPKGGYYPNGRQKTQAFVVSEVHGRWQRAEEVPGTAALSNRRGAQITSVSCGSAGHCSAGGSYAVSKHGNTQVFVVNRK